MEHSSTHLLSVILFTPLVGALLLLFLPRESQLLHRLVGNLFGVLGFLVSLPLMVHFPAGSGDYAFKETADWIPSIGAKYSLGADGISMLLVMLTTLLGMIAITSSWSAIQQRTKEYYILLLLLQTGMLGVFLSLALFLFYVFWEVMLVPMYFLIGVWASDRRPSAPLNFFLSPLAASLLMLLPLLPADPPSRATIIHIVIVLSVISSIYGAVVCLMQKDMKRLIAYSSVSHLGFCTLGIFALTPRGLAGSVLQQVNHGISTGALFLIVGVLYELRHTHLITEFGGLAP